MIWQRTRSGWLHQALTLVRYSRVLAYLMIGLAGLLAVLNPPASMAEATGGAYILQLSWAGLMTVAATFCAYGAATNRWVGEYIGLIPLSLVAAAFGVAALTRGTPGFAGGSFLLGFFWLLVSRWQEVALLKVEALRHADARNHASSQEGATGADEAGGQR